jgi:outer membrane lipoprotein-sorting protein
MMTKASLTIGLSFLLAAPLLAADKEVEALLAKMREAYSGAKTAKITIKTTGARFGEDTITTEVVYMKDRKIFAKTTGAGPFSGKPRTFISDGNMVSFTDFSGNTQRTRFDFDLIPIPVNLEAMSFWDWKRQLSTSPGSNMEKSKFKLFRKSWNGKQWVVLGETAHGQSVYVDYYIDPKTNLIHRVQVYDIGQKQLRLETVVAKFELNVRVDPGIFKVKPGSDFKEKKKIIF